MKKTELLEHLYKMQFDYNDAYFSQAPVHKMFTRGFCLYLKFKDHDLFTEEKIINELYDDLHLFGKIRAKIFYNYFFSTLEKSNFKDTSLKPRIQLLEKTIKRIEKLVQLDSVTII